MTAGVHSHGATLAVHGTKVTQHLVWFRCWSKVKRVSEDWADAVQVLFFTVLAPAAFLYALWNTGDRPAPSPRARQPFRCATPLLWALNFSRNSLVRTSSHTQQRNSKNKPKRGLPYANKSLLAIA